MKHIKKNESSRKGDFAEFYAVTWLWDKGYEVFKNCGCSGPVDLIAIKNDEATFIDVKTNSGQSGRSRSLDQLKLNVKLLNFNPETRKLKFVNHHKKLKEEK